MSETEAVQVSTAEAAELLGVSQQTVTRWVREGYLAARRGPSRFGKGRIRILRSEVERLLADGEVA